MSLKAIYYTKKSVLPLLIFRDDQWLWTTNLLWIQMRTQSQSGHVNHHTHHHHIILFCCSSSIIMSRRGYYRPPDKIHGCFAGSGTLLNDPTMGPHVIKLTGKTDPTDVTVVYLGTASYDLIAKRENQTSWYSEQGCTVIALDVVLNAPKSSYMKECIVEKADIILVSGGNTNFAMRRWKHIGLDKMLKEACLGPRRVVMAGGSAGAIW